MMRQGKGEYFGFRTYVGYLSGLRISQSSYAPNARLPRHSHSDPYICLVAGGSFAERTYRRQENFTKGMAVWNPSGEEHDDVFGSVGGRTWNLEFTDVWEERIAVVTRAWTPAQYGDAAWLAGRILRELSRPDTASALTLEGLVCALIGELSHESSTPAHPRPLWLSRAHERLSVEYLDPPTVGDLAREAGVHRSHFARTFRIHCGCTIAEFVRRRRVEWAAAQLLLDHRSLADVALQAGFGDQAHFTRAFKRVTGVTPGAYRAAEG